MGRESIEERRARLMPGAQWLAAERDRRGLSQRELGRRIGVKQDRISAYERAQDEPSRDFVRELAKEYGMFEAEIWDCLQKDLPGELEDPERAVAYYRARYPGVFARVLGEETPDEPGGRPRRAGLTHPTVTRKGDAVTESPQDSASGE